MAHLRRWFGALLLASLTVLVGTGTAQAHKPSDSYLAIAIDDAAGGRLTGRWDIALRDLDFAIGLDADGDGAITWGELRRRHADIAAYALARLALRADDQLCPLTAGEQLVDDHSDGAYTVLAFEARCAAVPQQLGIDYRLFADLDPQHRGLLRLEARGATRTAIFSPEAASQTFAVAEMSRWRQFVDYTHEGVWHIWIGFDHVLFLLALLLPAVLVRRPAGGTPARQRWGAAGWQPRERMRDAVGDVVKVVTAFTLAHSITLSLATLQVVSLPSRWVEATIALSVVLAALNNVFGFIGEKRWAVAFAFGLIHGFGFASVLGDLGLTQGTLALALVGFNVGVELGQLAIVVLFLPLAFALRHTRFYRWGVFVAGSLLVALLAGIWFVERAFVMQILAL